jgi:hypothetical protein
MKKRSRLALSVKWMKQDPSAAGLVEVVILSSLKGEIVVRKCRAWAQISSALIRYVPARQDHEFETKCIGVPHCGSQHVLADWAHQVGNTSCTGQSLPKGLKPLEVALSSKPSKTCDVASRACKAYCEPIRNGVLSGERHEIGIVPVAPVAARAETFEIATIRSTRASTSSCASVGNFVAVPSANAPQVVGCVLRRSHVERVLAP